MLSRQMIGLYSMLSTGEYLTADVLAQTMHVSSKTVRNQIKSLNEELAEYGARVESKHGTGYRLIADDSERIVQLEQLLWNREIQKTLIPDSSEERVHYLMEYLLGAEDYVKLDGLSETLFISKKTLTGNLKEVESILREYHLSLERKPNYGIRIVGREFNRRLCISGSEFRRSLILGQTRNEIEQPDELVWIQNCLQECLTEQPLMISNVAFHNLVMHILIAIRRMQSGHYIEDEDHGLNPGEGQDSMKAAQAIMKKIAEHFGLECRKGEVVYLAVHLEGKRTMIDAVSSEDSDDNLVIGPEISELVDYMLNAVYDAFRFDFRDDLELRIALSQHLVPLVVRLQHDMKLTNPLLREIKERYSLSYAMATTACLFLSYRYHTVLKEDEIAYIALIFALALERKKDQIEKKNILLVCASGKGSAELMLYRYRAEFSAYINAIHVIDVNQIEEQDFEKIDYIFTTVSIPVKVPVPIIEVQNFLRNSDIWNVKRTLLGQKDSSVLDVYREELFLPHMHFDSKEEALRVMCDYAMEHGYTKEDLYSSVLAREAIEKTAFENAVAMPHPITVANERPFALVALLDKPLAWYPDDPGRMIQAIFLVSVANNRQYDAQKFYRVTARLMMDAYSMRELIRSQDFRTLTTLLTTVERTVELEEM